MPQILKYFRGEDCVASTHFFVRSTFVHLTVRPQLTDSVQRRTMPKDPKRTNWVENLVFKYGTTSAFSASLAGEDCWEKPWPQVHGFLLNVHSNPPMKPPPSMKTAVPMENTANVIHPCRRENVCQVDEVWEGLFLGNQRSAEDVEFLNNHNIQNVLNITPAFPFHRKNRKPRYIQKRVKIADSADAPWETKLEDILEYLDRCYASKQSVLVHCRMGQSRSVSYVVAWAMLRFRAPMVPLLDTLDSKRHGTQINCGFRAKLGMIAEALGMDNMSSRGKSMRKRSYRVLCAAPRISTAWTCEDLAKTLNATSYIGIKYIKHVGKEGGAPEDSVSGKMLLNGMMLDERKNSADELEDFNNRMKAGGSFDESRSLNRGDWERDVAGSKAKSFLRKTFVVNVDGKPLPQEYSLRDIIKGDVILDDLRSMDGGPLQTDVMSKSITLVV
jgi:hypothetical protein